MNKLFASTILSFTLLTNIGFAKDGRVEKFLKDTACKASFEIRHFGFTVGNLDSYETLRKTESYIQILSEYDNAIKHLRHSFPATAKAFETSECAPAAISLVKIKIANHIAPILRQEMKEEDKRADKKMEIAQKTIDGSRFCDDNCAQLMDSAGINLEKEATYRRQLEAMEKSLAVE